MQITILGFVAVIIVLFAALKQKSDILLYAAVFFSGFTGASVINISTISIQPSYLFFILYFIVVIYQTLVSTKVKKVEFPKMLTIFVIYCIATLITIFFGNKDQVIVLRQDDKYGEVVFSLSNIIHIGYLLICYIFYTLLINKRNRLNQRGSLYKAYRLGVIAVIIICLYQIVAMNMNLPFDELFRQGVHGNVQGKRIYGPCIEASMLSYYLAPSLFLMYLNIKDYKRDIIWIALGLVVGVLCYSSTFFIGVILAVLYFIIKGLIYIREKKSMSFFVGAIGLIFIALVSIIAAWARIERVVVELVEKLAAKNESGSIRTEAFQKMSLIGLKYPFGVGFASSRSKDLFSTWMCNIGIVGMVIFTIMIILYINRCLKKNHFAETLPFIMCIILAMISVPEPYNLFIWVLMFFGMYGTKGDKITSRDDIIENEVYSLWWN